MSSIVYQKLEKPSKMFFVAPFLFMTEVVLLLFLLAVVKEPLVAIGIIVPTHLQFVRLSTREPHINNIIRNKLNIIIGNKSAKLPTYKTPMIIKDPKTEYVYVL